MSGLNLTAACRRGMKQDRERAKLIARNENNRRVSKEADDFAKLVTSWMIGV